MTVSIRQLHKHFFGEVSGVDLRKPLTPQEAADSKPAWIDTPCCCSAIRTYQTNSRWRSL